MSAAAAVIEFLKAHAFESLIVAAMAVLLLWDRLGGLLGGILGKVGSIAPGITFGRQENSRDALIAAAKQYRDACVAMGLPIELVDQFAVEAVSKTVRGEERKAVSAGGKL